MSEDLGQPACRNCQRVYAADELDRSRWCEACRAVVVRRATVVGRVVGAVGALGLMTWIFWTIGSSPRFLVAWMVLVAGTYFFLYKLVRRVAFEIIRARGVPPPED